MTKAHGTKNSEVKVETSNTTRRIHLVFFLFTTFYPPTILAASLSAVVNFIGILPCGFSPANIQSSVVEA
jgi:hypothetical protein